jgi:hypothetical protein
MVVVALAQSLHLVLKMVLLVDPVVGGLVPQQCLELLAAHLVVKVIVGVLGYPMEPLMTTVQAEAAPGV